MDSIHGHEVLNMMIESGEQYTHTSLEAAIKARFGERARFHTCSASDMTAAELVAFLAAKGKFIAVEGGFSTHESKILPPLIRHGESASHRVRTCWINFAYPVWRVLYQ
ncbi:putative metal-binding protein [Salmonella enterica subsp. enterica]|nr:putative metal-binding protein [Salmonella enterica subsp. enterica]